MREEKAVDYIHHDVAAIQENLGGFPMLAPTDFLVVYGEAHEVLIEKLLDSNTNLITFATIFFTPTTTVLIKILTKFN